MRRAHFCAERAADEVLAGVVRGGVDAGREEGAPGGEQQRTGQRHHPLPEAIREATARRHGERRRERTGRNGEPGLQDRAALGAGQEQHIAQEQRVERAREGEHGQFPALISQAIDETGAEPRSRCRSRASSQPASGSFSGAGARGSCRHSGGAPPPAEPDQCRQHEHAAEYDDRRAKTSRKRAGERVSEGGWKRTERGRPCEARERHPDGAREDGSRLGDHRHRRAAVTSPTVTRRSRSGGVP